jgi:hypothetical protein
MGAVGVALPGHPTHVWFNSMLLECLLLLSFLFCLWCHNTGKVCALGTEALTSCWSVLDTVRTHAPQLYPIVFSHTAQGDPKIRLALFQSGAKMVTCFQSALVQVLGELRAARDTTDGTLVCSYCGHDRLSENALHRHLELYHTYVVALWVRVGLEGLEGGG